MCVFMNQLVDADSKSCQRISRAEDFEEHRFAAFQLDGCCMVCTIFCKPKPIEKVLDLLLFVQNPQTITYVFFFVGFYSYKYITNFGRRHLQKFLRNSNLGFL